MSYTPTDWKTGDVITADKLNNMESGIVGSGTVTANVKAVAPNTYQCDKTYSELLALVQGGTNVLFKLTTGSGRRLLRVCYEGYQPVLQKNVLYATHTEVVLDSGSSNKYYLNSLTVNLLDDNSISVTEVQVSGVSSD